MCRRREKDQREKKGCALAARIAHKYNIQKIIHITPSEQISISRSQQSSRAAFYTFLIVPLGPAFGDLAANGNQVMSP
jgi:hypothetical protein